MNNSNSIVILINFRHRPIAYQKMPNVLGAESVVVMEFVIYPKGPLPVTVGNDLRSTSGFELLKVVSRRNV